MQVDYRDHIDVSPLDEGGRYYARAKIYRRASLAALNAVNAEREMTIKVRQIKYLNNLVKQDHRAIKRRTRPMLGFKDFNCARVILSGIELMHMIKKRQPQCSGNTPLSAAQQFYLLVS